jgi:hypothetical protein
MAVIRRCIHAANTGRWNGSADFSPGVRRFNSLGWLVIWPRLYCFLTEATGIPGSVLTPQSTASLPGAVGVLTNAAPVSFHDLILQSDDSV